MPSDFARYAQYEMNLESLRYKRATRMGIRYKNHTGPRHIFYVLDRGTRKFPGDLALLMQYIEFAKKEKSHKKLARILSTALRLHPTKPALWMYAVRYTMDEQADMTMARAHMQRGLRYCKRSKALWLDYAHLEMRYIAKIVARQKILGLDLPQEPKTLESSLDDPNANEIALPNITAEDVSSDLATHEPLDETKLEKLASSPALTGAIPIAVFDAAMKEFDNEAALAEQFFSLFAEFDQSPPVRNILQHVMHILNFQHPETVAYASCLFRLPLIGIDTKSAEFPTALCHSLAIQKQFLEKDPKISGELAEKSVILLLPFLRIEGLDEGIRRALTASIRQSMKCMGDGSGPSESAIGMIQRLESEGRVNDARLLSLQASKCWPSNIRLLAVQLACRPAS